VLRSFRPSFARHFLFRRRVDHRERPALTDRHKTAVEILRDDCGLWVVSVQFLETRIDLRELARGEAIAAGRFSDVRA
jgi:hypothetical protein